MALVAFNRDDAKSLIRERADRGANHHDEVWNGIYVMSPNADNEHFDLAADLIFVIKSALPDRKLVRVNGGGNISDRAEKWTKNYRCPDVSVFFPENPARDMGTHWIGGPDFAVEIISPNDRSRKKLAFYAKVGVRELLLVDRKPWSLELYRLADGKLKLVGKNEPNSSQILTSQVVPVSFRLLPGDPRPPLELTQNSDGRSWQI